MLKENMPDVLVLGAGPAGMAIASALGKEKLDVEVLSPNGPDEPWPNTYGIWGKEVDQLGLQDLLEYRWKNTVSFFGHGALEEQDDENKATEHSLDYGLFDKKASSLVSLLNFPLLEDLLNREMSLQENISHSPYPWHKEKLEVLFFAHH